MRQNRWSAVHSLRCWPILVGMTLLATACQPFAARGPATPPPPPPPPLAADHSPSAPSEPLSARPAPPPGPPAPAVPRITPALDLTVAQPAQVRTGRGPWYLTVAALDPGTAVEYVDSREGWLLVRTPEGASGWIASSDLRITDARDPAIAYRLQPGRWELAVPGGPQVVVTRRGTGVMRVAFSGGTETPRVSSQDEMLSLLTALDGATAAALAVGDGGIAAVSVSGAGVRVDLEGAPVARLLTAGPGHAELEFRPGLAAVTATAAGWQIRYHGDLRPVLRREAGQLLLDLPGATTAPDMGTLPPGVTVKAVTPEQGESPALSAFNARVPGRMPVGGLRLRLPTPAEPFALYRPQAGVLDLRVLPPGLAGKTVVVDAGHGGEETGAYAGNGIVEKSVNLAVALRLQALLEGEGARVIMTRSTDARALTPAQEAALVTVSERTRADLEARSDLSNHMGADLYLSIHANGGPSGESGTETYWAVPNLNAAQSQRLAELVQNELLAALELVDRGVRQRPFHVIRYTEAPAVLAELGFMTHDDDLALLTSPAGQQAAAEALLRAIRRYFTGAGTVSAAGAVAPGSA